MRQRVAAQFGLLLALVSLAGCGRSDTGGGIRLEVDLSHTRFTTRGGIGASWHAMSRDIPLDNHLYDYPVREDNPRGSAWGGNPPLENEVAWQQLGQHARWLGLDFLRVELSQRMYEPERRRFDWDNEEMQALYRILDWCQAAGADVFLQQMWGHVEWNAFPGVHPLLSAPRSLDDFADGLAELVEHLTRRKGYTCIRWLAITNEPPVGGVWGYWWSTGSFPSFTITPALAAVRTALDARGLRLPLSAPDSGVPPFDATLFDFDANVGAYDFHSYSRLTPTRQQILGQWAGWAHAQGKPIFLTEMGDMDLGSGGQNAGPTGFDAALSIAEKVLRGLAVGVDGFNRWSFTNRGDLDGQWQLVRTWDRSAQRHLAEVVPEPAAYAGFALLTRFTAKHSQVLDDILEQPTGSDGGELVASALRSPRGHLTVIAANLGQAELTLTLAVKRLPRELTLQRYQLRANTAYGPNLGLISTRPLWAGGAGLSQVLPSRSLTVWTTYDLAPSDPGVIAE